jgi:hypothetical protein
MNMILILSQMLAID